MKKNKQNSAPKPPPPPKPAAPVLAVPDYVSDPLAVAEFKRCVQHLPRITAMDRSLLADYCNLHAECINLQKIVEDEGYKLTGPKGGEYLNPSVTLLMHKQGLISQLRRDLFFTPKSRGEKKQAGGKALSILEQINNDNDND